MGSQIRRFMRKALQRPRIVESNDPAQDSLPSKHAGNGKSKRNKKRKK